MSAYKEIVTKAVVGKGKKYYKNTYTIDVGTPVSTVLGAWIINHKFSGKDVNKKIEIDGSFDVNLWYSYDDDTKTSVVTKTIPYTEVVMVSQKETTDNSRIIIDVEKELGVEIVGDTKVTIAIEEDEEPWDEIVEDVPDDTLKEIDKEVNEDYLKEEK